MNNTLTVMNSSSGRIQNLHVKDGWPKAGFATSSRNSTYPTYFSMTNGLCFNVVNCTNESVFSTFSRLFHQVAQVQSSSMQSLFLSGESNHRWLKVINALPAGLQMNQTSMRVNQNGGGNDEVIALDISGTVNSGMVQIFDSMLTGFPDRLLTLSNANCTIQQCDWNLDEATVPYRGIYLEGSTPSVCRMENMTFATYTPFYVTNAPNKRIEFAGCNFYEGGQFDAYTNCTVGSLSAEYLTSSTRIAAMATLGPVATAAGLTYDPQFAADANVLTNVANQSHILTNGILDTSQNLPNTISGWEPVKVGTNAMFMDMDVTSVWMTNSMVTNVQLLVSYYDGGSGTINVYYDSRTNGFTLAGAIGLANSGTWNTTTILLPSPAFSNRCRGADISLNFPDTSSTTVSFLKVFMARTQLMDGTTNVSNATAQFTGTPANGTRPLAVTFTDQSTGSVTNLLWNFGDAQTTNTAGGAVVQHSYTNAGSYTVILIASGTGGKSTNTQPSYITVNAPQPPTLTGISPAGTSALLLQGAGGPTNGVYYYWLLSSTNVVLPLTNWSVIATNPFDAQGNFSNQIPLPPGTKAMFYRLQLP